MKSQNLYSPSFIVAIGGGEVGKDDKKVGKENDRKNIFHTNIYIVLGITNKLNCNNSNDNNCGQVGPGCLLRFVLNLNLPWIGCWLYRCFNSIFYPFLYSSDDDGNAKVLLLLAVAVHQPW